MIGRDIDLEGKRRYCLRLPKNLSLPNNLISESAETAGFRPAQK